MDEGRRIMRARATLLLDYPFWGSLGMHLELKEHQTLEVGTMATDGHRLYYNPEWTAQWDDRQLVGVVAHEISHCAFGHLWRRENRHPMIWNWATDYAVNDLLVSDGFQLPPGCLLDQRFHNTTAEYNYARLMEEMEKQAEEAGGGDGGDGLQNGAGTGQCPLGGHSLDDPDEWRKATSKKGQGESGDGDQTPNGPGGQVDPDSGYREIDMPEVWRQRVGQAATHAKMQGKLPAHIAELIEDLLDPVLDWRTLLQDLVQTSALNDYRMIPPNKRYLWAGIYLPSLCGEYLDVTVGIDTSGSISTAEAQMFLSEIRGIAQQFSSFTCRVVECDASVQHWTEYDENGSIDDWPVEIHGRGGTSFVPVFDLVQEQGWQPQCLVYFTDMFGSFPETEPGYPVIWVSTSEGEIAPFGTTIYAPVETPAGRY